MHESKIPHLNILINKHLVIQVIISLTWVLAAPINIEPPNTFGHFAPMNHNISSSNTKFHFVDTDFGRPLQM